MGVAAVETLANNVLRDHAVRGKKDLPKNLLNEHQQRYSVDWWRLVDKVYFLPTLCNKQLAPPAFYFKRNSKDFKLFEELVEIRNSIMHGRPEKVLVLCRRKADKIILMNDNFPSNFWPISKIPRDFTPFNYDCAKIAYDNMKWVRKSLVGFLEKLDESYFREEQIKLISRIFRESDVDEEELLTNWREYVSVES